MQSFVVYLFSSLLVLAGCGARNEDRAQTNDVSFAYRSHILLFYIEGDDIFRAFCKTDEVNFNKETCQLSRRHMQLSQVYNPIKSDLESQVTSKQSDMIQWETKIKQIDSRLIDLLSSPVFTDPAAAAALSDQIDSLQARVADTEFLLTDIKNQIAQIRQNPVIDADYVALLNELLAKQTTLESNKSALLTEISMLRQEWLALLTDIHDQATFNLLQNQRKQAIHNWDNAQEQFKKKNNELVEILRVFKYIADNAITYDHIPDRGLYVTKSDVLDRINSIFTNETDPIYTFTSHGHDSTFCRSNVICAHTFVTPTRGIKAASISCKIKSSYADCSGIDVTAPDGTSRSLPGTSADVLSPDDRTTYAALWNPKGDGAWKFETVCQRSGSGPMSMHIDCKMSMAD